MSEKPARGGGQKENIRRKTRLREPPGTLGYFTRCCYARTALFARIIIYVHVGNLFGKTSRALANSTASAFPHKNTFPLLLNGGVSRDKLRQFASSSMIIFN